MLPALARGLRHAVVGRGGPPLRRALAQATRCAAATNAGPLTLEELQLDSKFTRELPGDDSTDPRPRQVHGAFWSRVAPTAAKGEPTTVLYSEEVAREIGLHPSECERPEFALCFAGGAALPGGRAAAYAQNYGGHQFGHWAGQLGDGRAIVLGEVPGADGGGWELQLKGAGRTPYSRFADGRAVLRSSIREFLASEFMAAAGVATTRALSLVATGDGVMRDMFYNGNQREEPGAVVCRVARSFIRFGTFQLPAARGGGEAELLRPLADHVLTHHYQHLRGEAQPYAALLREVCARTGALVAGWHGLGFTHGVLNTDNMSILGDTIDYGPYGFLERFEPAFTPNTTDLPGRRYAFAQQPAVGQWNCAQLANAMIAGGLMAQEEAQAAVEQYSVSLQEQYNARMAAKLGLRQYDRQLSVDLMTLMKEHATDFTNTFRALNSVSVAPGEALPEALAQAVEASEPAAREAWAGWVAKYRTVMAAQGVDEAERAAAQRGANPVYVPRNHVMQRVIKAAEAGEYGPLRELYAALRSPFEERPDAPAFYCEPAPRDELRLGVELLSCSS